MFIEKSTKILLNHKKLVSLHSELSNAFHKIIFKMPFNFKLYEYESNSCNSQRIDRPTSSCAFLRTN